MIPQTPTGGQFINFNTVDQLDGWTPSNTQFTCNQTGLYLITLRAEASRTGAAGGSALIITMQPQLNSANIPGAQSFLQMPSLVARSEILFSQFLLSATSGDILTVRVAASSTTPTPTLINTSGSASAAITIFRIL